MIVLAVLGFALSISYASASRSLYDAQQAEQNSYATTLAQKQIEEIRATTIQSYTNAAGIAAFDLSELRQSGSTDCSLYAGAPVTDCYEFYMSSGQAYPMYTETATHDYGVYYHITDYYYVQSSGGPHPVNYDNFVVKVDWSVTGSTSTVNTGGTDTVRLFYRVYSGE